MDTLVSVILPVCNSSKYLGNCLDSLLAQKHENLEIIAIDDNSKDSSAKILRKYRRLDKRIKFSKNVKRYGLAISLNRALKKAKGDFITFMNPNDVNSVWRIKKQIDFLKLNPKIVAVGTQTVGIDDKGKHTEKTTLPEEHEGIYSHFLHGISVQLETLMINKRLIPSDILYFSSNKYPFVYLETFIKLFKYGKFANLTKHLYYHRGEQLNTQKSSNIDKFIKHTVVAIKSITIHDYRPSIRTFFQPFALKTRNRLGLS